MIALQILFDIGIATGPVLGYVHQYYMIRKDKSVGSFSIDICGILLFANILRLNFYVFEKYDIALLFQSLIMIIAQIFLVHICTKYGKKSESMSQTDSTGQFQLENSDKLQDFWRWTSFATYFFFIAAFTFVTFSITVTFKQLEIQSYGVFVGLTALLSQSILIVPQILKNFKSKSTQGLSHVLVILNLSGDIFKLVYFIVKNQPFQFILCGVIQVCLDTFVIVQIFLYRSNDDSSIQKQHKTLIGEKKVQTDDDLKVETQKNFEQIQMKDAQQLYSDRQEQPQQFNSDLQTKDTENELKYPDKKTVQKESNLIDEKKQKNDFFQKENIQTQKINSSDVLTQRQRTLFNQTDKNSQLQMRKVASDQKTASTNNKEEYFHVNFSLPAKSMDNMQVQC